MPESLEETNVAVEMHSLLLSLAGLIDDELLGWCRELVAVGESDFALELVTGAVQADRVRLPGPVHGELLDAALRRRVLGRSDRHGVLPQPDGSPRMRHRFATDPAEHGFPARAESLSPRTALRSVPARLLRECRLWLSWRLTPSGGAPGPVPHPVVLIEVADDAGADVLAYQVAEVLSRAGVFASVEVFAASGELGDYHRAALAEATAVSGEDGGASGPAVEAGRPRAEPPPVRRGPNTLDDTDGYRAVPVAPEGSRRPPLHPVDRVITARGSAPRRPRPAGGPERLDDVASGLHFERGTGGVPVVNSDGQDGPADRRPGEGWSPQVPGNDLPRPEGQRPDGPRLDGPRPDGPRPDAARGPDGRPRPRPANGGFAGPANGPGPGSGPGAVNGPPRPPRPVDAPGDNSNLSDVEQRLLRQLHEELAAREDDGTDGPAPDGDQSGTRMFRSTNGGRKRPPPRPGPDRAG